MRAAAPRICGCTCAATAIAIVRLGAGLHPALCYCLTLAFVLFHPQMNPPSQLEHFKPAAAICTSCSITENGFALSRGQIRFLPCQKLLPPPPWLRPLLLVCVLLRPALLCPPPDVSLGIRRCVSV